MSVSDLRCDECQVLLSGPATVAPRSTTSGVRLTYHPGELDLRDDSTLLCASCWEALAGWLGGTGIGTCCVCGVAVERYGSLHVRRSDLSGGWQLCPPHAADLLNRFATVQPKFDRDSFRLPLDGQESGQQGGVS